MNDYHHTFMDEALRLAYANVEAGQGGPFGAVIVREGTIIGRGTNLVTSSHDPTAHAEVTAIREACKIVGDFRLINCQIYTSCEPCPMCLAAIYWSRLDQIFFGYTRKEAAEIGFDDDFLYEQIALPMESRSLPITSLALSKKIDPFALWQNKTDKVPY